MRWLLCLVLTVSFLLVSCRGDEGGDILEGTDVTLEMFDNRYSYTEVHIPAGGTVQWVGAGRNPHNAVSAGGEWSTEDAFGSLEQSEGDVASITYDQPGEYLFYCTFHGNPDGKGMAGRLLVEAGV